MNPPVMLVKPFVCHVACLLKVEAEDEQIACQKFTKRYIFWGITRVITYPTQGVCASPGHGIAAYPYGRSTL